MNNFFFPSPQFDPDRLTALDEEHLGMISENRMLKRKVSGCV